MCSHEGFQHVLCHLFLCLSQLTQERTVVQSPIFYQLDYLFISHGACLMDLAVHNSEATWRSDRFPVAGTVRLDEWLRGAVFRNTKTGWKPIEKSGYNDYKNLVMGSVDTGGPPATINEVQSIVETAAEWIPHTCRQERIRELKGATRIY